MKRTARGQSKARLFLAWSGILVVSFASAANPVVAENPFDIVPELADDGIYIAPSRSTEADPGMFIPVVDRARIGGVSMAVLWPEDPQPNTGAFARRVQEASMLDVVLVFGPDGEFGSYVDEELEEGSVRASAAARSVEEPAARASAYLTGLLEEPERERPPIVNDLVRWIVILLAALVAGAVGEQMIGKFKQSRKRQRVQDQRETAS